MPEQLLLEIAKGPDRYELITALFEDGIRERRYAQFDVAKIGGAPLTPPVVVIITRIGRADVKESTDWEVEGHPIAFKEYRAFKALYDPRSGTGTITLF